ncbi:putative transposable element [Trichonephila clavipes]|nr:putative transposable element [Trichonephila clavipes]
MSEEALVDHIFVRLEPQVQDYVEVRNPQNTVQLLEMLSKFEERDSCKTMWGPRNRNNVERLGWNVRRMSNADDSRRNWRNSEVLHRPSNGRNDYTGNYKNGRQGNQWFDSRNRFQRDDRRFNDRGYQFRNGVKITILVEGITEIEVRELWFQQDGATCHTVRATIDLLKDTFGDRLISRFGPVNWPPRSCDLTPLDYFLWGYVKSLVYADKPQTLDHLEDNIRRVIADIRLQMLEKVIENWTSRLDYIRASRGSHMPEIIFKI